MFKQAPPTDLELILQAAVTVLQQLKLEQAELPGKLRTASALGNAESIIALSDRRNKLPAYVYAAEITMQKAKIAVLEAEKAETEKKHTAVREHLSENIKPVFDEIAAVETQLKSLYSKRDSLQLSEGSSYAFVREVAIKIEREQNILKKLMNDHLNDMPQVDQVYERSDTAMYLRSGYGQTDRPDQQASSAVIPAGAHVEMPAGLRPLKPNESIRVAHDGD